MADQQCEAETNKGRRCKRKAKVTMRREWEESFLYWWWIQKEAFDHLCTQHASKAMVGVRVEE